MKHGYYQIKHEGLLLPARWDGEKWHHEKGITDAHPEHENVCRYEDGTPITFDFKCPTGCTCTNNPDGSVNVLC